MAFSFGFTGDDIEPNETANPEPAAKVQPPAPTPAYGAFPVPGKPQLPPAQHALETLLARLPSKIAFGYLDVSFNGDAAALPAMKIPRRELWDVRVQLMAEDDLRGGVEGLGEHDVKTGVYEGGFKSWESSVDLVKTLAATRGAWSGQEDESLRVIEELRKLTEAMLKLGCGTALPSLAMFQWAIQESASPNRHHHFAVADYNPTVLQLVTLPNFILSWAILQKPHSPALETAFTSDDELELTPEVLQAFQEFLVSRNITLAFLSGAWSPELVAMIYDGLHADVAAPTSTLLLGAETIYSPFALAAFTEMNFSILEREKERTGTRRTAAYIAAKRLYFGVGGSLDDFIDGARQRGGVVDTLREETDGVRRGVVRCTIT